LNRVGALNKIGKAYSSLEQEYEREPNANELAGELEMDLNEVAEALKIGGRHVSVDAPFSAGEENRLLDVLENDEQPSPDFSLMSVSLRNEIEKSSINVNRERS
jgi:RNA polymerase primary sigma factor